MNNPMHTAADHLADVCSMYLEGRADLDELREATADYYRTHQSRLFTIEVDSAVGASKRKMPPIESQLFYGRQPGPVPRFSEGASVDIPMGTIPLNFEVFTRNPKPFAIPAEQWSGLNDGIAVSAKHKTGPVLGRALWYHSTGTFMFHAEGE